MSLQTVGQSISGKVVDDDTGEPLPYVHIWYKGTLIGTHTNALGFFSLPNADQQILSVSAVGFERVDYSLTNGRENILFRLKTATIALKEVEIAATTKWKAKKVGYSKRAPFGGTAISFGGTKKQQWKVTIENPKDEVGYIKTVHIGIKDPSPDSGELITEVFFTSGEQEEVPLSQKSFIRKIDLASLKNELIIDVDREAIPLVPTIHVYITFIGVQQYKDNTSNSLSGGLVTLNNALGKPKKPYLKHWYMNEEEWKPWPEGDAEYSMINLWLELEIVR